MTALAIRPDVVAAFDAYLAAKASDAEVDPIVVRSTRATGDAPPFALARDGGERKARHAGVLNPARVAVQAFGLTSAGAARLLRLIAALVHDAGPLIVELEDEDGGRIGIWRVFDEIGVGEPLKEPETGWWVATGAFDLYMSDRAVG